MGRIEPIGSDFGWPSDAEGVEGLEGTSGGVSRTNVGSVGLRRPPRPRPSRLMRMEDLPRVPPRHERGLYRNSVGSQVRTLNGHHRSEPPEDPEPGGAAAL